MLGCLSCAELSLTRPRKPDQSRPLGAQGLIWKLASTIYWKKRHKSARKIVSTKRLSHVYHLSTELISVPKSMSRYFICSNGDFQSNFKCMVLCIVEFNVRLNMLIWFGALRFSSACWRRDINVHSAEFRVTKYYRTMIPIFLDCFRNRSLDQCGCEVISDHFLTISLFPNFFFTSELAFLNRWLVMPIQMHPTYLGLQCRGTAILHRENFARKF